MYSARSTRALPRVGFPIRRSRDQRLVSTSPALIAAAHVLHRLLAPRHPPCALRLLIVKNTLYAAMEFSRCTPEPNVRPNEKTRRSTASLSKLSSAIYDEVDIVLGELVTGRIHHGRVAHRSNRAPVFPRKEVIQPQLPLRLPCYDFTPVTNPTFDGFLPCGLEHRLRVLPASVM